MPKEGKNINNFNKEENVKKASVNTKKTNSKKDLNVNIERHSTVKNTKKSISKRTSSVKTTNNFVKRSTNNSNKKNNTSILEYYDLPFRYNETVVKVLVQTPNILFVYWDISDSDKENYIKQYGEYFFNDTKPVLIVYNDTMNYSFEVDINDFANSWYLHVPDSNCNYRVELIRRPINEHSKIDNYLHISSSNNMEAPNDHILFDSLNNNVYFRNSKTNAVIKKEISISFVSKIGKIHNVQNFYKTMYKNENINFDKLDFKRLSSS